MDLLSKLFKGDRAIWIIFLLLCCISLVEVFSASSYFVFKAASKGGFYWAPIVRHGTYLLVGLCAVLVLANIPNRFFSAGIIVLPLSIALLIYTFLFGKATNEASRFLSFGGITFQPSEFAKISCIIYVSYILSRKQEMLSGVSKFWWALSGVGATFLFIFPENFSTAFILGAVCFMIMILGKLPRKQMLWLTAGLLAGAALFVAVLFFVPQKTLESNKYTDRFVTWQGRMYGKLGIKVTDNGARIKMTEQEKREAHFSLDGKNFQPANAKIAIARGGLFGRLPGRSIQRDFLPVAHSDFIYAIIIEELGLIPGGIGVLLLYVFLLFRVAIIARKCDRQFPKFLVLGSGLIIVFQAFINMSVAVGLFPVTGQPLPLISSGGTSTVITCCYIGIILSVSRFSAGMDSEEEPVNPVEDVELEEGEESLVIDTVGIEEESKDEAS